MSAITRGTTATVTLTGTTGPTTSGATWEVRKAGTVVATSLTVNGWAVTRVDATTASVTVPATAATSPDSSTEDYEIRHSGLAGAGTGTGTETP